MQEATGFVAAVTVPIVRRWPSRSVHTATGRPPDPLGDTAGVGIDEVWTQVIGTQPDPPAEVVLGAAVLAAVLVAWRPSWRMLRGVVTIAHEGGHAADRITAMLWLALAALATLLPLLRNVYGVVSVVATGAVVFVLSWYGSAAAQAAFGYLFTWFLLFAAPRPVLELPAVRWRGRGSGSDADQLARLTGLGAAVWIALFGTATIAAAALALSSLMPWDELASVVAESPDHGPAGSPAA